jgi:hypothetical protein
MTAFANTAEDVRVMPPPDDSDAHPGYQDETSVVLAKTESAGETRTLTDRRGAQCQRGVQRTGASYGPAKIAMEAARKPTSFSPQKKPPEAQYAHAHNPLRRFRAMVEARGVSLTPGTRQEGATPPVPTWNTDAHMDGNRGGERDAVSGRSGRSADARRYPSVKIPPDMHVEECADMKRLAEADAK